MRYYAITKLKYKGRDGFRIYDDITKQVKDVPLENIENIVKNEVVSITNLRMSRGKLTGHGGKIDDLGIVIDGNIYKDGYIIISTIGDKYDIVDINGNRRVLDEDVVSVLVQEGKVFNAKGRDRANGGYYIMAKDIGFPSTRYSNIVKRKDTDKYTGEDLGGEVVNNILINSQVGRYTKVGYHLMSIEDERLKLVNTYSYLYRIDNRKLNRLGNMVQYEGYTLIGSVLREIDYCNENNFEEIRALIFNSDIIDVMNDCINNYNRYIQSNNVNSEIDRETGLYKPKGRKYDIMLVRETYRNVKAVDDKTVMDVINKLKVMKARVRILTTYGKENVALYRICSSKGIEYKVSDRSKGYAVIRNVRIEKLYEDIDSYGNIEVLNSKEFIVRGLDGNYKYNIDKIYEEYGTGKVDSRRELKAKVVGVDLVENVNERGELIGLKNDAKTISIPTNVKSITKDSILLNKNNKVLEFGEGIKKCNVYMFRESSDVTLEKVDIECKDNKVILNIIKALKRSYGICVDNVEIQKEVSKEVINEIVVKDTKFYKIKLNGNSKKSIIEAMVDSVDSIFKEFTLEKLKESTRIIQRRDSKNYLYSYELYKINRVFSELITRVNLFLDLDINDRDIVFKEIDKNKKNIDKMMSLIEKENKLKYTL